MAIHNSISNMVREALIEMYFVAEYSILFRKDEKIWNSNGCYGYPAAVLLFSIADSIGSYVLNTNNVERHFEILFDKKYYGFDLSKSDTDNIYKYYRNSLIHNSSMPINTYLDIGNSFSNFYIDDGLKKIIYLYPFLIKTKKVLDIFLPNANEIIEGSKIENNLLLK